MLITYFADFHYFSFVDFVGNVVQTFIFIIIFLMQGLNSEVPQI